MALRPAKRLGDHAAGARPDAFNPASSSPVHRIAKRSEPMPLLHGSTTVSASYKELTASSPLSCWMLCPYSCATDQNSCKSVMRRMLSGR